MHRGGRIGFDWDIQKIRRTTSKRPDGFPTRTSSCHFIASIPLHLPGPDLRALSPVPLIQLANTTGWMMQPLAFGRMHSICKTRVIGC